MIITSYIVKRGNKYLHMDQKAGVFWGRKSGAFKFYSVDAATQVACALTSTKAVICIEVCEEG